MKLRVINIFPLKDGANEEEFRELLTKEYAPLWRKVPGCLKVEVMKNQWKINDGPLSSVTLYATTELWDSEESLEKLRRLAAEKPDSDMIKQGKDIMSKWRQYSKEPIFLHCPVLHEED